jgi:hypothetical protein
MLKAIGFWITGLHDERQPAPQEFVGVMPADQRARLADYLAAGMTHESYLGMSWCRFGCGIDWTLMGTRDLTDGEWLWPEGLSHYVRQHQVVLPQEFIAHALSKMTPRRPDWPDDDLHIVMTPRQSEAVDHSYWQHWCASRRAPQLLERLRTGWLTAETLAAADKQAKLNTLERDKGLSDTKCIWKDCSRKALAGMYVCAAHHLGDEERFILDGRARAEFHDILGDLSRALGVKSNFSARGRPKRWVAIRRFFRELLTRKQ